MALLRSSVAAQATTFRSLDRVRHIVHFAFVLADLSFTVSGDNSRGTIMYPPHQVNEEALGGQYIYKYDHYTKSSGHLFDVNTTGTGGGGAGGLLTMSAASHTKGPHEQITLGGR